MAKAFPNTGVTIIDSSSDLTGFSPSEGLMVFQKDTNELKIYDGSNWISVVDTDAPPGLVYLGSTALSFGTSGQTVNNLFSSSYENYKLLFNTTSVTGQLTPSFQLTASGAAATSGYTTDRVRVENGNGAIVGLSSTNSSSWILGGTVSSMPFSFEMTITKPQKAELTQMFLTVTGRAATWYSYWAQGFHTTATAYDGLKFFTDTQTLTGNVRVYGFRD